MGDWAVCANYVGRRVLRWGARVRIILWTGGDPRRYVVRGLNHFGRRVDVWVALRDLRDFRPEFAAAGDGDYPTKDAAVRVAALMERARFVWGFRCPMLTWTEHQRCARRVLGETAETT